MKNSVLNELDYETGLITFKDIRYMFIRPETIVDFQKAVETAVGHEKCAELMMAGGVSGGSRSSRQYQEALGCGEEEMVHFMCRMGSEIGWGDFSLKKLELKTGYLMVEVTDSPFASTYGRSKVGVCHMIRGVLSGLGSSIFRGGVSSSETACMAKGDKICRFEIVRERK